MKKDTVNDFKSLKAIEKILQKETMGFLGLSLNNMPYVIPMTYAYTSGKILFHCALQGKKLDILRSNPHVCFTVGQQSGRIIRHPQGGQCFADHDSVICYGTARVVDKMEERLQILNTFKHCLQPEAQDIHLNDIANCYAVEIKLSKATARKQRKGLKREYCEFYFSC